MAVGASGKGKAGRNRSGVGHKEREIKDVEREEPENEGEKETYINRQIQTYAQTVDLSFSFTSPAFAASP